MLKLQVGSGGRRIGWGRGVGYTTVDVLSGAPGPGEFGFSWAGDGGDGLALVPPDSGWRWPPFDGLWAPGRVPTTDFLQKTLDR
jgi:hypothetical protein